MIFKEIVPSVIIITLIISILIARKIKRDDLFSIDGKFAVVGIMLGILITSLNIIYSNNYLITLGPLLTIACIIYLKNRETLLAENNGQLFIFNDNTLKMIQIIYWICIITALISYYQATSYYRPPLFFISISIAVAFLGLDILSSNYAKTVNLYKPIFKIFVTSIILRYSAYFISPYPVGSDPWYHAGFIDDILLYGTSYLPQTYAYYSNYPIFHIFSVITSIISNFTTKESMFVAGTVLVFSTLFVYLIVKHITNNTQIALFSMLLINFSDFHIQWSIQIIAMTFGIALYTIIIYLLIAQKGKSAIIYKSFLISFTFLIVLTHTVSSFILFVSMISLYIGSFIFKTIYRDVEHPVDFIISITMCILFATILTSRWMDPDYPFLDSIVRGLVNSFSKEAEFLGRDTISNIGDSWASIMNILGFLILIFFGIIGCLRNLSITNANKTKFSVIVMIIVLFFIFFAFPVMGLKNIVPYRWPAFIYATFVLFVGIGIFQVINSDRNKHYMAVFVLILLSTSSFFMITNSMANIDSPIYGKEFNQQMFWTESEMKLFTRINNSYGYYVITDSQTFIRPFNTYLKRDKVTSYQMTTEGDINWDFIGDKLIVWRKSSLTRSVQVQGHRNPKILLGMDFKRDLDNNYSNIFDTGEAKAYLNNSFNYDKRQ